MLFYTRDNVCPLLLIVFWLKRSLRRALFCKVQVRRLEQLLCFTGPVRCEAEGTVQFSGILASTLSQRISKSTLPVPVLSNTNLRSDTWRSPSLSRSRNRVL